MFEDDVVEHGNVGRERRRLVRPEAVAVEEGLERAAELPRGTAVAVAPRKAWHLRR